MSEEMPYELPPPIIVYEMVAKAAWDNNISDKHRLVCEMAADTLRIVLDDRLKLRREKEVLEAKLAEVAS